MSGVSRGQSYAGGGVWMLVRILLGEPIVSNPLSQSIALFKTAAKIVGAIITDVQEIQGRDGG